MSDNFFSQEACDRCGGKLVIRMTSWFTDETICIDCIEKESLIRNTLPEHGRYYEGCGFIPKIREVIKNDCF